MRREVSFLISAAILVTAGYFSWKLAFGPTPARTDPPIVSQTDPPTSRPGTQETRPFVVAPSLAPRDAPAPPPDAIEGVVADVTGAPIEDAEVQIVHFEYQRTSTRPPDRRFGEKVLMSTVTDAAGRFRLSPLRAGEPKNLRVIKVGFVTQMKDSVRVPGVIDFQLPAGTPVFGSVASDATGAPIAGVGVQGWSRIGQGGGPRGFIWKEEVFTKDDGTFTFEGAPAGEVNFRLYHPEFMDVVEDRRVVAGSKNDLAFKMTPGLVIEGTVMAKGAPLAGAEVGAKDMNLIAARWQARTDARGVFRMRGVRSGTFLFEVSARGFSPSRESVTIGAEHDFSSKNGKRVEFTVAPAGRAAGRVTSHTGEPVARARIFVAPVQGIFVVVRDPAAHGGSIAEGETRTDADGRYLVGDLVDGGHRVVVVAPGFAVAAAPAVSARPDEILENVDLVLGPAPAIRGTITDETRGPVMNAVVTVVMPQFGDVWFPPGFDVGQKAERTLLTDDLGRFRIEIPYAGKYDLRVDHPDFVLVNDVEVTVGIESEVVQDFTLKAAHRITGTVRGVDGGGAEGAVVTAWPQSLAFEPVRVRSGPTGEYLVTRLPAGLYRVHATKDEGRLTSEFRDEIAATAEGIHFQLTPGGEIVGVVTDERGAPIPEFQVSLRPAATRGAPLGREKKPLLAGLEERTEEVSDASGIFRLANVEPASWTLQILTTTHAPSAPVTVAARGGEPVSAGTIVLRAGGTVGGKIIGPGGAAAEGVTITLTKVGELPGNAPGGNVIPQRPATTKTGPGGAYVVRGLIAGEYMIRVESPRFVDPPRERLVVDDGATVERSYTLSAAASVTLEVRDEVEQLTPAVNVIVSDSSQRKVTPIIDGSGSQTTDREGRITLRKLPANEDLVFKLIRAGYIVNDVPKKLVEGDNGVVQVKIERNHNQ